MVVISTTPWLSEVVTPSAPTLLARPLFLIGDHAVSKK
jgi:hypothetical protein